MDIIEKNVENEFSVCDVCGYKLGFHVSFEKKDQKHRVILICPQCGAKFNIHWDVGLN